MKIGNDEKGFLEFVNQNSLLPIFIVHLELGYTNVRLNSKYRKLRD